MAGSRRGGSQGGDVRYERRADMHRPLLGPRRARAKTADSAACSPPRTAVSSTSDANLPGAARGVSWSAPTLPQQSFQIELLSPTVGGF
jgi:hypothetical protein